MTNFAPNEQQVRSAPLSRTARRELQMRYEQGVRRVLQQQPALEDAVADFLTCVTEDPGNPVYVETFLDALRRLHDQRGRQTFRRLWKQRAVTKAAERGDWGQVLRRAPRLLLHDPAHVPTLRRLAEACEHFQLDEAELRYLQYALRLAPHDTALLRQAARSFGAAGQFQLACDSWRQLLLQQPEYGEAVRMLEALDEEELPASDRELELLLAEAPASDQPLLELAERHERAGRLRSAERVLTAAREVFPGEPRLSETLEEIQVQQTHRRLRQAERQAATDDSDRNRRLVEQIADELQRVELNYIGTRSRRYPEDRQLRLELAQRLKQLGNFSEATRCFDEAAQSTQLAAVALLESGECLQHLRQFEPALERYQQAIEAADGDAPILHAARYRAGVLAAALGRTDQAYVLLDALVAEAPGYKDAASRLDKLAAIRDKE